MSPGNTLVGGVERKAAPKQSAADIKRARRNRLAADALNAVKPEAKHAGIDPFAPPSSSQMDRKPQLQASNSQPAGRKRKASAVIDLTLDDENETIKAPRTSVPPVMSVNYTQPPQAAVYQSVYPRLDCPPIYDPCQTYSGNAPLAPSPTYGNASSIGYDSVCVLPLSGSFPPAPHGQSYQAFPPSRATSVGWPQHYAVSPAQELPSRSYPPAISAKSCSCGVPAPTGHEVVLCANPDCEHGNFHRKCVGLSTRKENAGWRCYKCRPKAPAASLATPTGASCAQDPPTMNVPLPTNPALMPAYTPTTGEPEPLLHPEQAKVVRAIENGQNVFYTGSAGTGKSTVLKAFVQKLKKQGKHVDIIAPSGIAALNVGGMTIHAYAGWHVYAFKEPLDKLVTKSHSKNVRKRLCQTDVLVIDEISMVERDVLVRLNVIMKEIRQGWTPEYKGKKRSPHTNKMPFGGTQIVVTGDFCQLPPVKPFQFCLYCGGDELPGHEQKDGRTLQCNRCKTVYKDEDKWAFRSDTWELCKFQYYELQHIHRQSDKIFIDILQKCRFGHPLSAHDQQLLLTPKPDPVGAVKLLPRRAEADTENSKNYRGLTSIERKFECVDFFSWRNKNEPQINQKYSPIRYPTRPDGPLMALKDHRLEEQIQLKEGMLVILITNLDFTVGLVNGSQGKIIGFEKHDDQKVFEPKASSSPPRGPTGFSGSDAPGSEYAQIQEAQVRLFLERASVKQWPIVEFQNGVIRPIYAECQLGEHGSEKPYSLLGRTQIPLLAAWAITVHKSQGMTLNRVIVDLFSSFEKEMVYVALSRARSLEGLKVLRLARQMEAGVNKEVHEFLSGHGMGL